MSWKSYNLDREAQKLVLFYRGKQGVIGQSHKMRSTVAYGLERFWGEQLRLLGKNDDEKEKGKYWQATWKAFVNIMKTAGIQLPQEEVDTANTRVVQDYASRLWSLSIEDQRICLAVLTQFCDSLVWWTQRYKNRGDSDGEY
ncbi:hypothetical protein [Cylindrospermopsis raciborskii]|uniref:hypothetical protein n=1 Tax=Cylindrospermopsis raciborskii TaxID=77022 RepID=UPI0001C16307|nr:hypothetical protein [Cylindrospermopsis raciborskii]EFA73426.1 hypothetical protein CRD_00526 [Raphidiopsis brookii D9]MCZ2202975.1 hypothetical protein [Cylindrospermopsis raciborskii PAMP2012]MCZ2206577.1 hypothetical protein [Cylindrospermopsis raciborskii PAMP2011]